MVTFNGSGNDRIVWWSSTNSGNDIGDLGFEWNFLYSGFVGSSFHSLHRHCVIANAAHPILFRYAFGSLYSFFKSPSKFE